MSARAQVRVLVRALLGNVPELSLHGLDRPADRDRLARDRVPPHLVVAEQPETELLLLGTIDELEADLNPGAPSENVAGPAAFVSRYSF